MKNMAIIFFGKRFISFEEYSIQNHSEFEKFNLKSLIPQRKVIEIIVLNSFELN